MHSSEAHSDHSAPAAPQRRGFLKKAAAVVIGGFVGLVPAVAGLATFLNPLRKSVKDKLRPSGFRDDGFCKVASLDTLQTDQPQAFRIIADRHDAWNTYPQEPIGAVYLCKTSDGKVQAFNVTCPHAGCAVDYRSGQQAYHCPCHNSSFDLKGKRDAKSPSPRNLDSLECEVSDDGQVWVKYEDFKTGDVHKKPKA